MAPVRVWVTLLLIRRLREFLAPHISLNSNFHITEDCEIKWHGIWCRTVAKVRAFGLEIVESFRLDVVILQLGSNDLVNGEPLSIASAIENLVTLPRNSFQVRTDFCRPDPLSRIEYIISAFEI